MGRSNESTKKKEVRTRKEKKRKDKEKKRLEKKDSDKKTSMDDMIAYVDENGNITATPPEPDDKHDIEADDIEVSVPKSTSDNEKAIPREGTITYFNDAKGYGFIKDSQTGESVFVHVKNLSGEAREGNKVSFEIEKGPKGLNAIHVKEVES